MLKLGTEMREIDIEKPPTCDRDHQLQYLDLLNQKGIALLNKVRRGEFCGQAKAEAQAELKWISDEMERKSDEM